jgi:hypothetical protein
MLRVHTSKIIDNVRYFVYVWKLNTCSDICVLTYLHFTKVCTSDPIRPEGVSDEINRPLILGEIAPLCFESKCPYLLPRSAKHPL